MNKIVIFSLLLVQVAFANAAIVEDKPYFNSGNKSKYKYTVTRKMCDYSFTSRYPGDSVGYVVCKARLVNLPISSKNREIIDYRAYNESRVSSKLDPKTGLFELSFYDFDLTKRDMEQFIQDTLIDVNRRPHLVSIGRIPSEFNDI